MCVSSSGGEASFQGPDDDGARVESGRPVYWGVEDFYAAYRAKRTSPTDVVENLLVAIPRIEAQVRTVFTEVQADEVRKQARASAERWQLGKPLSVFDGVPIAVKEEINVRGHIKGQGTWRGKGPVGPQTWSAATSPRPPAPAAEDDPIVVKFRAKGAIIVGVTAMTEFGFTPLGWSAHAQGPTNAHDPKRYSGGSSAGSAVAVATGLVPVAVGFDGGGSIRIPAALSGVHGLAAGFRRIKFGGAGYERSSMTHTGPLAGTVRSAALAFEVMTAEPLDARDSVGGGCDSVGGDGCSGGGCSIKGLRVGVFPDHFKDATPEVVERADIALDLLTKMGAQVVQIAIPNLMALSIAHGMTISSEMASIHDRYFSASLTNEWPLEASTKVQMQLGQAMTGAEIHAANTLRSWGIDYFEKQFFGVDSAHKLDAIVGPTTGRTAPEFAEDAVETGESNTTGVMQLMKFIFLGNLLGLPAQTVPVGQGRESGLPVGFQVMGDHGRERTLLQLACALDQSAVSSHGRGMVRPSHFFTELDGLLR